ncbi:MAG: hypothetical protein GX267_06255 [Fibrobacter sp.]|nr:hypothetical protein [Fibrobacter sp.]
MNTNGISRDDAWAQFMKLTQEARVRNSGLAHSSTSVSTSKKESAKATRLPLILNGASYNMSKPDVKRVILGGKFDAYA